MGEGIALLSSVLPGDEISRRKCVTESLERILGSARLSPGKQQDPSLSGPEKVAPTASSVTIGAVYSSPELSELLTTLAEGSVGKWVFSELGGQAVCDLDQAWIRRQYAPGDYPPLHSPHGWHQDGALGFQFNQTPDESGPASILNMVTCWIPFDACGLNAPGLEFVHRRLEKLLGPAQLTDTSIRSQFPHTEFWHPVLEPGDALVFRGDILHRTYVASQMTRHRTSIELRFFSAAHIPDRISKDRFLVLQ